MLRTKYETSASALNHSAISPVPTVQFIQSRSLPLFFFPVSTYFGQHWLKSPCNQELIKRQLALLYAAFKLVELCGLLHLQFLVSAVFIWVTSVCVHASSPQIECSFLQAVGHILPICRPHAVPISAFHKGGARQTFLDWLFHFLFFTPNCCHHLEQHLHGGAYHHLLLCFSARTSTKRTQRGTLKPSLVSRS